MPGSATAAASKYATATQLRRSKGATKHVPLPRSVAAAAGRHRIVLLRALRARKLAPGRYRIVVRAVAADGARSAIATVPFWVLKRS
jgi:hypothetical protein